MSQRAESESGSSNSCGKCYGSMGLIVYPLPVEALTATALGRPEIFHRKRSMILGGGAVCVGWRLGTERL
jgi:hypothetical protein